MVESINDAQPAGIIRGPQQAGPAHGWSGPISVRTFAWHDLITFYRYRHQVVCTDSAQALTRGSPVRPLAFLAHFNPAVGICTCIQSTEGSIPLIGQVLYAAGDRSARLTFLMPDEGLSQPGINELLDRLAAQAGAWGAFHLLAEVDESSAELEGMRRSGFSVYAWQRVWKYAPAPGGEGAPANGRHREKASPWQAATSMDEGQIRSLFQSLVPPLVQSAEPLTSRRLLGWVYRHEGEILAYVESIHGPNGIYLLPLVHPAVENVNEVLTSLLKHQRHATGRQIYVAIRSYQAWLETVICDLECQIGLRQALLVKHLVLHQRVAVQAARHSVLEKYTAEPSAPMVPNARIANK